MTGLSETERHRPGLVHIVDDDELVRATISHLLSRHGYASEIYTDGSEFFRDCSLQRGCIFLDLRMPGMNGYRVLEQLARLGNGLPVVVMSAYGDVSAAVRAMRLGAVDFIEKPASNEDILAAVARALEFFGKADAERKAAEAAANRLSRLTSRQGEIVQGLLDGLCSKGIGRRLGLCPRTVELHRANIKVRLGVKSLAEIVRLAIDAKMVPTQEAEKLEAPAADCFIPA